MKYIFTEEQFLALLAVGNIERLYSFKMIDDMEDEALIDAVHSLTGGNGSRRGRIGLYPVLPLRRCWQL